MSVPEQHVPSVSLVLSEVVKAAESRQVWSAVGAVVVAIASAVGLPIPSALLVVVETAFGAVFADGAFKAAVAIHKGGN